MECFNTLWIYTTLKHSVRSNQVQSVLIPYEFTLLSNAARMKAPTHWVLIPYEFTLLSNLSLLLLSLLSGFNTLWIYTTLKHNAPITKLEQCFNTLWIYTTLKHSYGQITRREGFNTLWIYTTLKQGDFAKTSDSVLIPYEFTLLSNTYLVNVDGLWVLIPYEFTLLSNALFNLADIERF